VGALKADEFSLQFSTFHLVLNFWPLLVPLIFGSIGKGDLLCYIDSVGGGKSRLRVEF
jgi:hypothetical protein